MVTDVAHFKYSSVGTRVGGTSNGFFFIAPAEIALLLIVDNLIL